MFHGGNQALAVRVPRCLPLSYPPPPRAKSISIIALCLPSSAFLIHRLLLENGIINPGSARRGECRAKSVPEQGTRKGRGRERRGGRVGQVALGKKRRGEDPRKCVAMGGRSGAGTAAPEPTESYLERSEFPKEGDVEGRLSYITVFHTIYAGHIIIRWGHTVCQISHHMIQRICFHVRACIPAICMCLSHSLFISRHASARSGTHMHRDPALAQQSQMPPTTCCRRRRAPLPGRASRCWRP